METPRLVTLPREQYLRRDETRIRSEAGRLQHGDPAIAAHLNAVLSAEDLHDYHLAAEEHFEGKRDRARTERHQRLKDQSLQLKLHHLDQLAHLIL